MSQDTHTLDLRNDMASIAEFLKSGFSAFAEGHKGSQATGLQVWFQIDCGLIYMNIWDDPEFEPFADNSFIFSKELNMPHWQEHFDNLFESRCETITHDGKALATEPDPECEYAYRGPNIADAFGQMIVLVLKKDENVLFESLPRADHWEMAVGADDEWEWATTYEREISDEPSEDVEECEENDGRVPCDQCGARILPSTAEATGGICMVCKNSSEGKYGRLEGF